MRGKQFKACLKQREPLFVHAFFILSPSNILSIFIFMAFQIIDVSQNRVKRGQEEGARYVEKKVSAWSGVGVRLTAHSRPCSRPAPAASQDGAFGAQTGGDNLPVRLTFWRKQRAPASGQQVTGARAQCLW